MTNKYKRDLQKSQELFNQASDEIINSDKYFMRVLLHSTEAFMRGSARAAAVLAPTVVTGGVISLVATASSNTRFFGLLTTSTMSAGSILYFQLCEDRAHAAEAVWLSSLMFVSIYACSVMAIGFHAPYLLAGNALLSSSCTEMASRFLSPELALSKAKEAFSHLSGANAERTLALLQEAQEIDQSVIEPLSLASDSLPDTSEHHENEGVDSQASSNNHPITTSSSNESANASTITPIELKRILTQYIEHSIVERAKLITVLQEQIAEANKPHPETLKIRKRRSFLTSRGPL